MEYKTFHTNVGKEKFLRKGYNRSCKALDTIKKR